MQNEQYLMKLEMMQAEAMLEILDFKEDGSFKPLVHHPELGKKLNRAISTAKDVLGAVNKGTLIPKDQLINRIANNNCKLSAEDWSELMKTIDSFEGV